MYAILNSVNTVIDIEERDLPLNELIHPNFEHLYIDIQNNELGIEPEWIYSPVSKNFSKPIKEYFFFNSENVCVDIKTMSGSYVDKYMNDNKYSFYKEYNEKHQDYDFGLGYKYIDGTWLKEEK